MSSTSLSTATTLVKYLTATSPSNPTVRLLNIEHFFPADDPFFTESTEDRIIAAATKACA